MPMITVELNEPFSNTSKAPDGELVDKTTHRIKLQDDR